MLTLSGNAKIFLYQLPIDLRNGFEGLSAAVDKAFVNALPSGAFFVFLNKPRNRMKVLYWDNDGLAIWYKRLEKGKFSRRTDKVLIERREFFMMLEGIVPQKLQKRFKIS